MSAKSVKKRKDKMVKLIVALNAFVHYFAIIYCTSEYFDSSIH